MPLRSASRKAHQRIAQRVQRRDNRLAIARIFRVAIAQQYQQLGAADQGFQYANIALELLSGQVQL